MIIFNPISMHDGFALKEICRWLPTEPEILEIGCGKSTRLLGSLGNVCTVDMDFERLEYFGTPNRVHCNSLEFEPKQKYDLIFLDGNHTYPHVKQDIDKYLPWVKEGGYLCGHDFECHEFYEKDIGVDFNNGRHSGVIKAVTETFKDIITFPNSCVWAVKV